MKTITLRPKGNAACKIIRRVLLVAALFSGSLALNGCATSTQRGAAGGAIAGAGLGAIVGHQSGRALEGAAIGGAIGVATGAIVGDSVEKNKHRERGHYEYRMVTRPDGRTYRQTVWVRD